MLWFIAALFLISGLVLLGFALAHLWRARQSQSWPAVEALVSSVGVANEIGEGVSFRPEVRFSYSFGGQVYESTRVRVGWSMSATQHWAASLVARYPKGSRVSAAVDPQEPAFCVLERGVHGFLWVSLAFSVPFMAVGFYTLAIALGRAT